MTMKMKMVRTLMASKQGAEVNASFLQSRQKTVSIPQQRRDCCYHQTVTADENGDVSAEDGDAENDNEKMEIAEIRFKSKNQ
jgi:hypothetical protein